MCRQGVKTALSVFVELQRLLSSQTVRECHAPPPVQPLSLAPSLRLAFDTMAKGLQFHILVLLSSLLKSLIPFQDGDLGFLLLISKLY